MIITACLGLAYLVVATSPSSAAATSTRVTLDFDGGSISQYNLGYLNALQPHSADATFFINSGTVGASANFSPGPSWARSPAPAMTSAASRSTPRI
ncbi:MAG: hypothetical protein M3070_08490 [Actinomycetota bacterium]|nr:hypothetical protein [Actinomycetota bacterium]